MKPPTAKHSHPKVPCRERTARQGVFMWLGGRKEGNGYQGNLMDGTGGDDGHSCVDRGERLRKNAGTPLETPDRKITSHPKVPCRERTGRQGHSCGAAEARKRTAAEEHEG